jgi:hypothetical protein
LEPARGGSKERRLSRAVPPHERDSFAALHSELDAAQDVAWPRTVVELDPGVARD